MGNGIQKTPLDASGASENVVAILQHPEASEIMYKISAAAKQILTDYDLPANDQIVPELARYVARNSSSTVMDDLKVLDLEPVDISAAAQAKNLRRAELLLEGLRRETAALEGKDDDSEVLYAAARAKLGGANELAKYKTIVDDAVKVVAVTKKNLNDSWVIYQSLTLEELYLHCSKAREKFVEVMESLQKELLEKVNVTAELSEPQLKKRERAKIKMEIKYGGDVSRLTDIFRGTMIFETIADMYAGVQLITAHSSLKGPGGVVVTSMEDRFQKPMPKGYGDIMLQLVVDGVPGELQLNVRPMYNAKSGGGHARYRVERFTNEYLLWSVIHKLPSVTRRLVCDHNALPDLISDKNGFIAIHFACRAGDQETTRLLLEEGKSSPLVLADTHELPLDLALHCRHWETASLVLESMQSVFDSEGGEKFTQQHIVALDRNLKIAEQGGLVERWVPGGGTRPFDPVDDALPLRVVAQLSSLLLACVTMPSDDIERYKFTKHYSVSDLCDVYEKSHSNEEKDDPLLLIPRGRAKCELLVLVNMPIPDPTCLLKAVDECLSLGYEESDVLIARARLAAKSQGEIRYVRCVTGTNIHTTLSHGVAGCFDPDGSPSFAARHPDPKTGELRAGKCGVGSGVTVGACFVFDGYEQRVHEYEVLVTDPRNVQWVHAKLGDPAPNNAIVVGANENTRRYHMRGSAKRSHGTGMVPGEVEAVNGVFADALIPYGGGGMRVLEFDVLIFAPSA